MLSALDADILVPINLHEVDGLASQTVHYVPSISYPRLSAFKPALLSQASPDLLERYSQLVRHKGILRCYLQTELGHGSNVARLETTATYVHPAVRRVRDPLADDDR